MASSLSIKVGALSSTRTYANDTMVSGTLMKFYVASSLGPATASNQEKLNAVARWLEMQIVEGARRYEREMRMAALEQEINDLIGLG